MTGYLLETLDGVSHEVDVETYIRVKMRTSVHLLEVGLILLERGQDGFELAGTFGEAAGIALGDALKAIKGT
jgi:hypothetical protein